MSQELDTYSEINSLPLFVRDLSGQLVEVKVPRFNPLLFSDLEAYIDTFLSDERRLLFIEFLMDERFGVPQDKDRLLTFMVGETEYQLMVERSTPHQFLFVPAKEDPLAPFIMYKKERSQVGPEDFEIFYRTYLSNRFSSDGGILIRNVEYNFLGDSCYEQRGLIVPNDRLDWGCDLLNYMPWFYITSNHELYSLFHDLYIGLRINSNAAYCILLKAVAQYDFKGRFELTDFSEQDMLNWVDSDIRAGVKRLAEILLVNLAPGVLGQPVYRTDED